MARHLTDKGRDLRRLVTEYDGDQHTIAALLGISQPALSARLNSEMHGAWWRAFKKARAKRRKAARHARWYARAKARGL